MCRVYPIFLSDVPHAHQKNKMKKYQLKTREVEAMQTCYRVEQCSSTGVPRVVARSFAETDRIFLGRNSQPQFHAAMNIRQCHRFD